MMGIFKGGEHLKEYGSAIILCGGKSSRMGFDKSRIRVGNSFLIELIVEKLKILFDDVIVIAGYEDRKFENVEFKVIQDVQKDCGPVGGIYTGLKSASSEYVFVTACDMPFINVDLIKYMITMIQEHKPDCIILKNGKWIEPLYAFYSKSMIDTFCKSIKDNDFKLFEIISSHKVYYIEEEKVRDYSKDLKVFANLNYIHDLDILRSVYGEEVNIWTEK